jgi:glycosyltransferase involved in cell wall biosynthesis
VTVDETVRTRRIAVNTAIYEHGTSGSATATRALVDALTGLPDVAVCDVRPSGSRHRSTLRNAVRDARWDLWQASRAVPDVDLLVSPCNIGLRGAARKHLLVVYDAMVFDHPELFDRRFAAYFRLLVPLSLRRADVVLTMSEHAAARLHSLAPEADIRVARWPHQGGDPGRASFPSTDKVVLMVGATEPVKNHASGIAAVARLRGTSGADVRLRVIGPAGRAEEEVRAAQQAADPEGTWISREIDVPTEVLDRAYTTAWVLLQPSLDEGFGLPLVEAGRHGVPAVHSGRGPMSEFAPQGNAGGASAEQLAEAMNPLLEESVWTKLAEEAMARSGSYGPEQFRAAIRASIDELLRTA